LPSAPQAAPLAMMVPSMPSAVPPRMPGVKSLSPAPTASSAAPPASLGSLPPVTPPPRAAAYSPPPAPRPGEKPRNLREIFALLAGAPSTGTASPSV
jgi:hypothetical protein